MGKKIPVLGGIILLALTNNWFHKIFSQNITIAIILLVITIGLSFRINNAVSNRMTPIFFVLLLIIDIFIILTNFDQNLITHSNLELAYLQQRETYYPHQIGKLFHNQLMLALFKYERNLFTNFDLNQFFFGGHPRLRSYALDFEKFPIYYLPFFLYGIIWLFAKDRRLSKLYFIFTIIILILTAFLNPSYYLGPITLYPILSSFIFVGFYQSFIQVFNNIKSIKR